MDVDSLESWGGSAAFRSEQQDLNALVYTHKSAGGGGGIPTGIGTIPCRTVYRSSHCIEVRINRANEAVLNAVGAG